jgi:hypothetical protein
MSNFIAESIRFNPGRLRSRICLAAILCALSLPLYAQTSPINDQYAKQEVVKIRASADKLIASGIPDDVAKGAVLLEKAAALEQSELAVQKLTLDREKLSRELEDARKNSWKDLLTTLLPLATTLVLVGTLIFQMQQAHAERQQKRDAAVEEAKQKKIERDDKRKELEEGARLVEKQRFTNAMKDLQISEKVSTAAAVINTFRDEPYRSQVLDTAVTLLLARENFEDFESLFMEVLNPLTYANMPQIRRLCKAVDSEFFTIATPVWNEKIWRNEVEKLSEKDRKLYQLYSQEQLFLSNKLAGLLRTPAPQGLRVDLSGLNLREMDLSGVDLGTANISATNWTFVKVDNCDMSRITDFENCVVHNTSWWHSARISPSLLEHLENKFAYSPDQRYNTKYPVGPEEYAKSVAQLKAGGSATGGSRALQATPVA